MQKLPQALMFLSECITAAVSKGILTFKYCHELTLVLLSEYITATESVNKQSNKCNIPTCTNYKGFDLYSTQAPLVAFEM